MVVGAGLARRLNYDLDLTTKPAPTRRLNYDLDLTTKPAIFIG
jgi:hypothetical protein